jgi:D-sedoheptulose 7-phosphate isomerase
MQTWIHNYITAQHKALDSISTPKLEALIHVLKEIWKSEKQVFVIGNGGSASNASHFATDLGKGSSDKLGKRFRVLSLTDNISWITALGNDYAYERQREFAESCEGLRVGSQPGTDHGGVGRREAWEAL